jgi:hypothetical protein
MNGLGVTTTDDFAEGNNTKPAGRDRLVDISMGNGRPPRLHELIDRSSDVRESATSTRRNASAPEFPQVRQGARGELQMHGRSPDLKHRRADAG